MADIQVSAPNPQALSNLCPIDRKSILKAKCSLPQHKETSCKENNNWSEILQEGRTWYFPLLLITA